jgi:flavin-dependent dehydrogenase
MLLGGAISCTADSADGFMEEQSVVVVGAGPAGTCAAMALANAGASVTVYEKRSEDTFVQDEGEPYAIVLEKRALDALSDAGFLDADFHGSTCALHSPTGCNLILDMHALVHTSRYEPS